MSVIDKKILGANLCDMECTEKNATIHPETCVEQVLTAHSGTATLTDWLTYNENDPDDPLGGFEDYNGLRPWLIANYPHNTYTLPKATTSTLGGVIVGSGLNIDGNGVLSTTPTPTINTASFTNAGIIKLGNDSPLISNFSNNSITGETISNTDFFPIRLDSNNRAGIAIPKSSYTPVQSDWLENNPSSNSYINHKPTIPTVNDKTITITQGEHTYSFTLNQGTDYSFQLDDGQPYELPPATENALGGIQLGYDASGSYRAVQLDENNNAYVDVTDENLKNHVVESRYNAVYDQYGNSFPTWKVRCQISNELLNVVNFKDFIKEELNPNHYQSVVTPPVDEGVYKWSVITAADNQKICIMAAQSSSVKGAFTLVIEDQVTRTSFTCPVGFILDTPSIDAFAWWSLCPWDVELYSGTRNGAGISYVFLKIPNTFQGEISIKDRYLLKGYNSEHSTWLGANVYSIMSHTGTSDDIIRYWNNPTEGYVSGGVWEGGYPADTSLVTTPVMYNDNIVVPVNYRPIVDAFVEKETMQIGDRFYDNDINDCVIHTLSYKVQSLESRVAILEDLVLRRNTQALAIETLPTE